MGQADLTESFWKNLAKRLFKQESELLSCVLYANNPLIMDKKQNNAVLITDHIWQDFDQCNLGMDTKQRIPA